MDAHTNIETLSFELDTEEKDIADYVHSGTSVEDSDPDSDSPINPLNPLLGAVPLLGKRVEYIKDSAKRTPIQAVLFGLAQAAASADGVTGTGTLDVLRYGRPLEARRLVGVRGAGPPSMACIL
jgi:hypothetical protein